MRRPAVRAGAGAVPAGCRGTRPESKRAFASASRPGLAVAEPRRGPGSEARRGATAEEPSESSQSSEPTHRLAGITSTATGRSGAARPGLGSAARRSPGGAAAPAAGAARPARPRRGAAGGRQPRASGAALAPVPARWRCAKGKGTAPGPARPGPRSGAGLERRLPRGEPGALAGRGLPVVPRLPGAVPPPARRPPRPGTSALRGSAPRAGAPSPGARRPRRCCAEPPSGPRRPRTPWSTGDAGRTGRPRQARKAPEDGGPAVPLRAARAADWRSRAGRARSRPGPAAALPAAPGAAANGKQTLPRWWFCSTALCRFFCCCYLVRKLRNGERGARGAHSAHGAVREGRKLPRCTSR